MLSSIPGLNHQTPVINATCDDQKRVQTSPVAPLWVKTTHSWELLITCSCLVFQVLSWNLAWMPYLQNQKIELDNTFLASSSKDIWTCGGQRNRFIVFGGVGLIAKLCPTLATIWTVAHQATLSMGFPRQEYWSRLLFSSPRSNPGPLHCRQILCSIRFFKP